jgi:cytochrome c oxidase cbb3-type subunit 3
MVLYPSIPLIRGGTGGVLGYSTRATVEQDLATAKAAQASLFDEIAKLPLAEIQANADLDRFAVAGGRSAFLVNCVQCHGSGAAGSKGYPNLNDDDWLWGGTLEDIHQTISHGIRSPTDPDTRVSEMPPFGGPDGTLTGQQIDQVAEYVLSLAGKPHDEAAAAAGAAIFGPSGANCASCHGDKGQGNRKFGGPALNDAISLKAGNKAAIVAQITNPKMGVMPAWSGRLSEAVIKELSLYVYSLGGGEAPATN